MSADITPDEWRRILDSEELPLLEVAERLADARGLSSDAAYEAAEDAVERGVLIEDSEAGGFGRVRVAGAQEAESGPESDSSPESDADSDEGDDVQERALAAFRDAIAFMHDRLDKPMGMGEGRTAREYLRQERGWSDETIERAGLGWAPPGDTTLLEHLMRKGYDRDAILGTGLFYGDGNIRPHFRGRLVFPYFDRDGEAVYAIARTVDHPDDHLNAGQKYVKAVKQKEYSHVDEPIYGLGSLKEHEGPVLITEGIADAITAHAHGWRCLSPVTKEFKKKHLPLLADELADVDATVYVVQDAEPPSSSLEETTDGTESLYLDDHPTGIKGAVKTAAYLQEEGIDAQVGELPLPSWGGDFQKVDLDDFLLGWGDLNPVLRSAKPARQHPAYDPGLVPNVDDGGGMETADDAVQGDNDECRETNQSSSSRLFDLDLTDVAPVSPGFRGKNPLGHHGDSEDYFVVDSTGETATEWKHGVAYNALTYLLVAAEKRDADNPNGRIDGDELFAAWAKAKQEGALPEDDPVPYRALVGVAIDDGLVDEDELVERDTENGDSTYTALPDAEAYNAALEHVRDEYDLEPGRGPWEPSGDRRRYERVVTCEPPGGELKTLDVDDERERIHGEIYDQFTDHDGPMIEAHDAGVGKTTTTGIAAADRDRRFAMLFDKHRKAHEFRADDVTPDVDLHLRGAEQPRDDRCAQAAYEDGMCPEHGAINKCPRMCPVYDLDPEHEERRQFEALAAELGPVHAHVIIEPHDGDECDWMQAISDASDVDTLAGVHEYQALKAVRRGNSPDPRDVAIDETPGLLDSTRRFDVEDLTRFANTLDDCAGRVVPNGADVDDDETERVRTTLSAFATFTRDIIDIITDAESDATLDDLEAPTVPAEEIRMRVDPDDLPDDVDPDDVREIEKKRGAPGNELARAKQTEHVIDVELTAEVLAKAKFGVHRTLRQRISRDDWEGTPFAFDALLAAAVEAGLDADAARRTAALPVMLDGCPRCGHDLEFKNGGHRFCEHCAWDEHRDFITERDGEQARITAWTVSDEDGAALVRRQLPNLSDLPDDPLVLDATATPEKVAAMYGVESSDVAVRGRQGFDIENLHLTQVLDGQYHHSTVMNAVENDSTTAQRIQRTLDMAGRIHDRPLVVGRLGIRNHFDLPENAEFIHFHGARGLNFEECDAVVVIGAPHPDMDELRRNAELLAQGRDDLRVGGEEHSTRRGAPNPPVYRKLRYTDDDGRGRAVATKHYTGLVGALFREKREKELEQVVHRIRPLLADEQKHAYLVTNVPTALPVDEVCSFEELADPVQALLPVADGALRLAEHIGDVQAGEAPEGFRDGLGAAHFRDGDEWRVDELHRLAQAHGEDVSERTVRRWVDDLEEIGLLDGGEYDHRQGIGYESPDGSTLTRALSVLHSNGGVEVAVKRRLARLAQELDSAAEWIAAARDQFGLTPDRCDIDAAAGAGPPPG